MSTNANTRTNEQAIQNLRVVVTHEQLRFLNPREVLEVLQSLEQIESLVKSLTVSAEVKA